MLTERYIVAGRTPCSDGSGMTMSLKGPFSGDWIAAVRRHRLPFFSGTSEPPPAYRLRARRITASGGSCLVQRAKERAPW